jgi:hypothetical protein
MKPLMPTLKRPGLVAIAFALSLSCSAAVSDVAVVVSARSSLVAMGQSEIVDIFLGNTRVLPNGDKAMPIDQAEGSAIRDEFYAKFAGKSAAQMKAHWSRIIFTGRGYPPKEAALDGEAKKRIVDNPNAIGYLDPRTVDSSVRVLQVR